MEKSQKNFQNFEKKGIEFATQKEKKELDKREKEKKCKTRNQRETTFFFFEICERRAKEKRVTDLRHLARTRTLLMQPI